MDLRYIFYSVVASLAASGLLTFTLREWISARIKSGIQHDYDRKLETYKAELKSEQELAILNIKTSLAREAAFHAAAHSSFAEGQKAAIERKLNAVDRLWNCVLQIRGSLPAVLTLMDVMTVDDYRRAKDDPKFRTLTTDLTAEKLKGVAPPSVEEVRPCVGEYLWAVFSSYQSILIRILTLLLLARTDAEKIEWYKDSGTRHLIDAMLLPAELQAFDELRFGKFTWLQRWLEAQILAATQKVISGEAFGAESLEQARLIQQRIDQLKASA
jgi:hypothetical protein